MQLNVNKVITELGGKSKEAGIKRIKILFLYQESKQRILMSLAFSLLYSRTLTSIHGYWKNHADVTLLTKVRIVKAMVFPVVMYGCESWAIKKAECQRIDAFELWC